MNTDPSNGTNKQKTEDPVSKEKNELNEATKK
jgi:hypothetical protein